MNINLKFIATMFIVIILFLMLYNVRKNKIDIKYSVVWFILFSLLFVFLIIPGFLEFMTNLLGFEISSNMIFSLLIAVLVIINISFTSIISSHDKKIRMLIQEISILKGEKDEK